jgi:hypothetical protein
LLNFQLAQIKIVNLELFPFRPLEVNLGKEQPVCDFVLIKKFVVFCNYVLAVLGKYVFGDLLEVSLEVVFEIA